MISSLSRRAATLTLTLILGTGLGGLGDAQDNSGLPTGPLAIAAVPVFPPAPELPLPVDTLPPAPPAAPLEPLPEVPAPELPTVQPPTPQPPTPQPPTAETPPPSAFIPPAGSGVRGLWVDAFGPGLKTRAQVTQMVDDAARMGVNTLFVQAIRRSDCLCLRASVPTATDRDLEKGLDPLGLSVRLAHARGMRVIAWVSVTGIANTAAPNTSPAHVSRTHGPTSGAASWVARRPDGSWQEGNDVWLDLGIPEAAEYAVQGILSLVKNYDIDGVQLDRIRYPDGDNWGYDPKVLARYRAETGRTGIPAAADPQWEDWKRQQVTAVVRRVTLEIKTLRPDAWITAATITYMQPPAPGDMAAFRRTRTYSDVLQDWPAWMQSGLLDLNVLMNYKRDAVGDQGQWFDGWNAFARSVQARPDGRSAGVAAGTAMYLNGAPVTAAQAGRSVGAGLGWVGYSYRTPTVDVYGAKETMAQGLSSVQRLMAAPGAALSVPVPWKEKPPTTRGLLGRVTGTAILGSREVQALQNGQVVARALTDGSGYYGFAALPPGRTEVWVSGQRWEDTVPERGVVRLPDLTVRELRPIVTTPAPATPALLTLPAVKPPAAKPPAAKP
ncbi:glycoside hydrolase family 10 protein [Deinococcus arenicola]|uniref:Family 10 glycosylhydrolase n=1 Tax=Deinococcus arenicola TaxID=2994950 RepID=A0ABU4DT90_9DEIO|nr:family 10 glycosylhydrolase [Deinococcus sp. ZS9-10]MDV6375172.1 family 10 glycosylhydrolase [Deinococcus sp. ZS9-10]